MYGTHSWDTEIRDVLALLFISATGARGADFLRSTANDRPLCLRDVYLYLKDGDDIENLACQIHMGSTKANRSVLSSLERRYY